MIIEMKKILIFITDETESLGDCKLTSHFTCNNHSFKFSAEGKLSEMFYMFIINEWKVFKLKLGALTSGSG